MKLTIVSNTIILIATCAISMQTWAQNSSKTDLTCPSNWEMTDKQLQGEWTAAVSGDAQTAHIALGPHPEWKGNVKGTIRRGDTGYPMVGDLNQGAITLEESSDGQRITGTWLGEVAADSCGREIRGSFQTSEDATPQDFVMRKQP